MIFVFCLRLGFVEILRASNAFLSAQGMDTGEELLVDIVDDADGSPSLQPMSWVVEEIGRAVGEVREKGPLSCLGSDYHWR